MLYAFIELLTGAAGRGSPLVIWILETGGLGPACLPGPGTSCLSRLTQRRTYGRSGPPAELTTYTTESELSQHGLRPGGVWLAKSNT